MTESNVKHATKLVTVRLPTDVIEKIEAWVSKKPGMPQTVSGYIRDIIVAVSEIL